MMEKSERMAKSKEPRHSMKVSYLLETIVVMSIVAAQPLFAHEFEMELFTGGDTNPNELSASFDVDTAPYGFARATLKHMPARTGFYYKLDAKGSFYFADGDAVSNPKFANETRGEAVLGFKWRPRLKFGRARFKWDVYTGGRDTSYVRKSTGQIARIPENGTILEIPNRFDAAWFGVSTSGVVPISDEADFLYDVYVEDKQYFEYTNVTSQSILDYQQSEIDIGFEKRIWPRTNLKTMIGAGVRIYQDRRAKEVDTGNDIPGTDLEFSFLEVENTLEYLITDRWKWQFGLDIDQRKDNEEGYYDTTQGQLFMRFRYRNQNTVKFLLSMSYVKREYDNIDQDPTLTDEELKEREGYRVRAELSRAIFEQSRLSMDVVIGVESNSYENSNPNFTYDQNRVYFGVRWHP
ncbi:MAG: hypothetical protein OEY38_24550 [Gammaproteobacteria bacterium]|nr:hypothetical protein [Gammaproteobacteria bacterium]